MACCAVAGLNKKFPLQEDYFLYALLKASIVLITVYVSYVPILYLSSHHYSVASFALILDDPLQFFFFPKKLLSFEYVNELFVPDFV